MEFVVTIFYFLALVMCFYNVGVLFSFPQVLNNISWLAAYKKITDNDPNLSKEKINAPNLNPFLRMINILHYEVLWFLIALLSSNWEISLIGLILSSFSITYINKVKKLKFITSIIILAIFILRYVIMGALAINHFHYHQNLMGLIKNWI